MPSDNVTQLASFDTFSSTDVSLLCLGTSALVESWSVQHRYRPSESCCCTIHRHYPTTPRLSMGWLLRLVSQHYHASMDWVSCGATSLSWSGKHTPIAMHDAYTRYRITPTYKYNRRQFQYASCISTYHLQPLCKLLWLASIIPYSRIPY